MKKVLAIFLLTVWLFQSASPSFYYEIGRMLLQWKMFVKIKMVHANPTVFRYASPNDVPWEEQDEELMVDGKLYDVVKIVAKSGMIQIHCIADDDETTFLRYFISQRIPEKSIKKIFSNHYFSIKYFATDTRFIFFSYVEPPLFFVPALCQIPDAPIMNWSPPPW